MPRWRVDFVPLVWILALAIGLPGCGAGDPSPDASGYALPVSRPATAIPTARSDVGFLERHQEINAWPDRDRIELVFLGDSITQRWESDGRFVWNQRFAALGAANFGVSGDRTQNVLWRIESGNLDGVRPRGLILQIGTNNTLEASDEDIVYGVLAIVEALRERLPKTRILVLGVFPKHPLPIAPIRARIVRINAMLSERAPGPNVVFLDIGDAYLESDGQIAEATMPDGLHLSARGYTMWADAMEPALLRLLAGD